MQQTGRARIRVLDPGPLSMVQDLGRPGLAGLGIGRSGVCDRAAARLANALVGNSDDAAVVEVTFGGVVLQARDEVLVALAGARCEGAGHHAPFLLGAGERLRLGAPVSGLRTYVAVRGGIDSIPVLGSRAGDQLAGIGPAPLAGGDELVVGTMMAGNPVVDLAPVPEPVSGTLTVAISPGPRRDWFQDESWRRLLEATFVTTADINRVGVRLQGPTLERSRSGELPSEGMLRGAVQVPTGGQPVIFLADHPVTGGYPVIAYVDDEDVDRCAQLRPGQRLRFRQASDR